MVQLKLVKAGYGSLEEVRKMTARQTLQALAYETFLSDYEAAFMELNKQ